MNAEEKGSGAGLPGDVAESGGDVGPARVTEDGEDRIAQSGHELRCGAAADMAGIFAEGDIANIVGSVLDAPMAADVAEQHGGGDRSVQTRDEVAHLTCDDPRARSQACDFADLVCTQPIQVAA